MSLTEIIVALVGMVSAVLVAYIGSRVSKRAEVSAQETAATTTPMSTLMRIEHDNIELRRQLAAKAEAEYVEKLEERLDRADLRLKECEDARISLERRLRTLERKNV